MNFLTLKKAAYSFALLSIIGTPQIVVAADVDEVASITGRIIRSWGYITEYGSEMRRYLVSRPTIDGERIRSAYLKACTGPSESQCESDGYEMVDIGAGVALGSTIESVGLVTAISKKRNYSTYYMDATADILKMY